MNISVKAQVIEVRMRVIFRMWVYYRDGSDKCSIFAYMKWLNLIFFKKSNQLSYPRLCTCRSSQKITARQRWHQFVSVPAFATVSPNPTSYLHLHTGREKLVLQNQTFRLKCATFQRSTLCPLFQQTILRSLTNSLVANTDLVHKDEQN